MCACERNEERERAEIKQKEGRRGKSAQGNGSSVHLCAAFPFSAMHSEMRFGHHRTSVTTMLLHFPFVYELSFACVLGFRLYLSSAQSQLRTRGEMCVAPNGRKAAANLAYAAYANAQSVLFLLVVK